MTQSDPTADKRTFKRIGRKFIMRISVAQKGHAPVWSLVSTHDLSAGGALFTLDQNVKEGDRLWVKIHFLERVIDCKARVVRFTPGFQKPLVHVGVVFEALEEKDKEFIENFCGHFNG